MLLGARATFVATLRARGASSVLPINSAQPSSLITPPFISSFQRCFSSSSSPSSSPSSSSSTTTPSSALATTNASSTPARRVEKIPSAATGEFTVQGPDSKFSDVENKPKVVWRPTWQSLYQTEEGKTVKGYEHSNKRLFEGKTPTVPQKYIPTLLPPAPDIRERDEEKEHFEGDVPDASVSGMTGGLRERPPESRGVWLQARNEMNESVAVGRRKRASANVRIVPNGDGSLWVNDRPFAQYFPEPHLRERALVPFVITETLGKFTTYCSVSGGGTNSQAEALTQGIARALQKWDPAFRSGLKLVGLLKRDPREVERKKPGQPKARKKFQWSKR